MAAQFDEVVALLSDSDGEQELGVRLSGASSTIGHENENIRNLDNLIKELVSIGKPGRSINRHAWPKKVTLPDHINVPIPRASKGGEGEVRSLSVSYATLSQKKYDTPTKFIQELEDLWAAGFIEEEDEDDDEDESGPEGGQPSLA